MGWRGCALLQINFRQKPEIDSKKSTPENLFSQNNAITKKCVTKNNDHKMRSQKTITNHRSQSYKNDHKITRETRGDDHKIIKTITKSQNEVTNLCDRIIF